VRFLDAPDPHAVEAAVDDEHGVISERPVGSWHSTRRDPEGGNRERPAEG
jgi:hypothetical protein